MFGSSRFLLLKVTTAALALIGCGEGIAFGQEAVGRAAYEQKCLRCHGKAGEGTKEFPHPLVGNRSLEQLTRYISKSMPEDAPGTCVGKEAAAVAGYIFDAFYSPAAQARIKAPRTELAHLTVSEYRNALADLFQGSKSGRSTRLAANGKEEMGLRGEYFTTKGKRNRTPAFSRVDAAVDFDLGPQGADYEKLKAEEISANWQGSVLANTTGTYEFVVRTEHSTRLWVNDLKRPLIDKAIKSGSDTEFHGEIFLVGGRTYPIRLEFSRGNVGVRKDPKDKAPTVKTTIALLWKAPHRALQVIPAYNLRPESSPMTFAVSTPFPPDDRSSGYERGNSISKAWIQATVDGAIETANFVQNNLPEITGVGPEDAKRREKLQAYCEKLVERAFRRSLTAEQKKLYVERQFQMAKEENAAVKRVILLTLQSPRFLYREPDATSKLPSDQYDIASRLSFSTWDSLPDQDLLAAARDGKLKTRAELQGLANRMLDDTRARAKMRGFLMQWLKLDHAAEIQKDAKHFPGFNDAVVSDLRTSLDLFLDDTIWSERSDYRQLHSADHLYLNGRLSELYGGKLPPNAPFQKVSIKSGERKGVVTHPLVLTTFSYAATSSPIHRGVFLAKNMLGVALRTPTEAFAPLPTDLHPNLSTRERIALQTKEKACQSCHIVINPLGFTLERFDAIGRARDQENGKPIDATGSFLSRSGDKVEFRGADELANFLLKSDEAHEAFVARLFHHLVRQPILAYGPEKLTELRRFFAENDYNVRRLAVEILVQTALPREAVKN